VLAISGVSGGIFSSLMMIRTERGEKVKVGILVPFYTYHLRQCNHVFPSSEPVFISTNPTDFSPNWDAISTALNNGLDLLLFCNPGNPQGNVWKKEDIQKLVTMTREAKCTLLIDEIYCDLVWKGQFFSPIQEKLEDHVIVCRGFSKTLGCQSWRCGYLVSSAITAEKIMRIHDPIYISVTWQQHAIASYLTNEYSDFCSHVKQISQLMQQNWEVLSKSMQLKLGWQPVQPEGSMYGLLKHQCKTDREAVLMGLRHGVGVAPGKIFYPGTPENTGYIRIHCGITAEKAKAIVTVLESD